MMFEGLNLEASAGDALKLDNGQAPHATDQLVS
jgi:hypothetical protein